MYLSHKVYRGCFIDMKTLAHVTTNKSFDAMDDVAKTFGIDVQHFRDTTQDNVENALTLHKLYSKITAILQDTFLVRPSDVNKLYSPASIGKLYLERLNITPFMKKNPRVFKRSVLGYYHERLLWWKSRDTN